MTKRKNSDTSEARFENMLLRLPIACDWVSFKDEVVVAQINYEATKKAGKPMMDLSYCMTKALNQVILKTVQWDKKKFKPCDQTKTWNYGET